MTISVILMLVAFVLFVMAAIPVAVRNVNLVAAGLACWALSIVLGSGAF